MTDQMVLRGAFICALLSTLAACGGSDTAAPSTTTATPTGSSIASPATGSAVVALSSSTYSVPMSATTAVLTVNRIGGTSGVASVSYATVNGTATAGTDYSSTSGTVTWADGDTAAKSIAVPVSTKAAGKTFAVALTAVTGDASFGAPTSAIIAVGGSITGASGVTPSASGTMIPSATQIVDSALNVWTLASAVVYKNGVIAGASANVTLLLYYSGAVYQRNKSCLWWSWNGSAWVTASDPSPSTVPVCPSSAASASTSASSGSSSSKGLSIKVQSNHLVDANGNTVQLRGVNVSALEFVTINDSKWDNGNPWGNQTGTATPQWSIMADTWKANAVRLPLNQASWLGYICVNKNGASINPDPLGNYKATVEQAVSAANAAGLYVILDLHWTAPGNTCPQSQDQMADRDHSLAFWTSVASTFKGNPAVLFDLFNEPYVSGGPSGYANGADYWAIWLNGGATPQLSTNSGRTIVAIAWSSVGMNQLIAAVRATGATNVVMAGGLAGASDLSGWLSHKPTDALNQLALSWHAYSGTGGQGGYAQAVLGAGIPVIIGETGDKSANGTSSAPTIANVTKWADANDASVMVWAWDDWSSSGGSSNLLIKDAAGTPTDGEGVAFKAWLLQH
jgi:hypothetical protein